MNFSHRKSTFKLLHTPYTTRKFLLISVYILLYIYYGDDRRREKLYLCLKQQTTEYSNDGQHVNIYEIIQSSRRNFLNGPFYMKTCIQFNHRVPITDIYADEVDPIIGLVPEGQAQYPEPQQEPEPEPSLIVLSAQYFIFQ